MNRGLPYSLALHLIVLVVVFLFGNSVARKPLESPRSIRVQMVRLPRTQPVETPAEQPVVEQPKPKDIIPDLPPKELPKPKPEVKKPQQREDPPPRRDPKPDPVPDDTEPQDQDLAPAEPVSLGPSVEGTDTDFPFAWYLQRVEGLVARNWNPRQLGFGKRAIVSCAVHFQVARGGAVSQVTLVRESGIGVFDRESLRAVQTTSLPPLPPQYPGSSLGVTFIFNLEPGS